jgi:hypothetical protein
MELADEPMTMVAGDTIELDDLYEDLDPGDGPSSRASVRTSAIRRVRRRLASRLPSQMLSAVTQRIVTAQQRAAAGRHHPHLLTPGRFLPARNTVTVYGNVVKATNGEPAGDARRRRCVKDVSAFHAKQSPLTYVAPTVSRVESTSQVRSTYRVARSRQPCRDTIDRSYHARTTTRRRP